MAPPILRELVIVLRRRGIPDATVVEVVEIIGTIALQIPGAYQATRLNNIDPDDNMLLAAAYEGHADYLVSLDRKHLLPLKHYHGTQILSPGLFIRTLDRIN